MEARKFSEHVASWLSDLGYTHCFFLAGGNSMHLLDGVRKTMTCIPFVHEVSATVAAEYFNQFSPSGRAFVLLTAGPGLTNSLTGMAGAFHEGRELLVIGGQVKSSDLTSGSLRQRGIQEVNGVELARPVTVHAQQLQRPISQSEFVEIVQHQWTSTPGPVFIEMCLDVQGASHIDATPPPRPIQRSTALTHPLGTDTAATIAKMLANSSRPVILVGGGVDYHESQELLDELGSLGIPLMTTYNGADRVPSNHSCYFGRPNTWGMRYANMLIAQADLVLALGTRLGLQQTGFNWQSFVPNGKIVQVDISQAELDKQHPKIDLGVASDAATVLRFLATQSWADHSGWLEHCRTVKAGLPLSESCNSVHEGYHNPYDFLLELSDVAREGDLVVPSSSGGAFTAFYQAFLNKPGQRIVSDKSLASMGYGLAGAIGASIAHPTSRVLHVEGDGSFSQNLQELATVSLRRANLKSFVWSNEGYASIRMTQRNYFNGDYLGCDVDTGLGFPNWELLGAAYDIPVSTLAPGFSRNSSFVRTLDQPGPALFIVPIHREQTFFPKISSRITAEGSMESEPLWEISPHLTETEMRSFGKYLPK